MPESPFSKVLLVPLAKLTLSPDLNAGWVWIECIEIWVKTMQILLYWRSDVPCALQPSWLHSRLVVPRATVDRVTPTRSLSMRELLCSKVNSGGPYAALGWCIAPDLYLGGSGVTDAAVVCRWVRVQSRGDRPVHCRASARMKRRPSTAVPLSSQP